MAGKPPVRLSELPPASALKDVDMVEVTQDGASRRTTVKDLYALGKSAYTLAKDQGYAGSLTQWIASLKGDKGDQGIQGIQGIPGIQGIQGPQGIQGNKGDTGATGGQGIQGIQGLKGDKGDTGAQGLQGPQGAGGLKGDKGDTGAQGPQGTQGIQGIQGLSAYQVAVAQGYAGTLSQWLTSLQGPQGIQGLQGGQGVQGVQGPIGLTGASAYEIAVAQGYSGNSAQWLSSLIGASGTNGTNGTNGSVWLTGAGAPATGIGAVGDMYLDTSSADYYQKTGAAVWTKQGTLTASAASVKQAIQFACSDETTAITAATGKTSFRMPYDFSLSAIKASLSTAQVGGAVFTVDLKVEGVSILSTKITFDNGQKTSQTAAIAAVLNTLSIYSDDEITVDVTQIGDGTAKGLKLTLVGTQGTFASPAFDPAKSGNGNVNLVLSLLNRQMDGGGGAKTVKGKNAGKWYFEAKLTKKTGNSAGAHFGFANLATGYSGGSSVGYGGAYAVMRDDGSAFAVGTGMVLSAQTAGLVIAAGDVFGMALDLAGLTWKIYKNGVQIANGTMAADTYYGYANCFNNVYAWLIPTTPQYLPAGFRWWGE